MPEHQREIIDSTAEEEELAALAEDFDNPFDQITAETVEQPPIILDEPEEPQKPLSKKDPATDVPVYRERPEGKWRSAEDFLRSVSAAEDERSEQGIETKEDPDHVITLDDIVQTFPERLQGFINRARERGKLPNSLEKISKMTPTQLDRIDGIGLGTAQLLLDKVRQELTKNSTTSPS